MFSDERGSIEFITDETIGGVQRIFSKAGTTRSNHYHKTDWHILYVVSGELQLWERAVGTATPLKLVLKPGHYIKTGPMVEHTTKFPVDTVLLCFSGSKRDRQAYENDVVRTGDLSVI